MANKQMWLFFIIRFIHLLQVCSQACACTCMEGRGQLVRLDSLLSPCGSPGSNSGHQVWRQQRHLLGHVASPNAAL